MCFRRSRRCRRRRRRAGDVARGAGVVAAAHKERALSPPRPSPAAGCPRLVLPAAVDWSAPRIIESGKSERQSSAEEAEPVFSIPNLFLWGPGRTGEESVNDVVGRGTASGTDGPIAPAPRLVTVESALEAHDR